MRGLSVAYEEVGEERDDQIDGADEEDHLRSAAGDR